MLPKTPLLQVVPSRVNRALLRIEPEIWRKVQTLEVYWTQCRERHVPFEEAVKSKQKKITSPFDWGKLFDQSWFRIVLPKTDTSKYYLGWKDQGESTAYIDGVPFYGFDVAHHYCRLPSKVTEIWMEVMCCETGMWPMRGKAMSERGCHFKEAALHVRNDEAWEVYHDLKVLFDLLGYEHGMNFPAGSPFPGAIGYIPPVEKVSVLYRQLCRRLDEAIDIFDHEGLPGLKHSLKKIYKEFNQALPVRCILTGHAHIDLVWMWPEKAGESKAMHTFATMNRLMDLYPEFRFGYSQPASYQAVEKRSPKLISEVKKRIKQGKWDATGAAQVESDTVIACGEALARSFIVGQEGFKALRGDYSNTLWLPDVFGYAGCLPQIMKQSGVDHFFTTKLTWSTVNKFPYSSFIWQGIDGTDVTAHVTHECGYNGQVLLHEIANGAKGHRQVDVHPEYLAPTGHGDGGGGPTEAMCERARRLAGLSGMPKVEWGGIEDFFNRLSKVKSKLPVYRGELYLEYHRGVFTTHSHIKHAFRLCERALQSLEAARVVTDQKEIPVDYWKRLIFAQFHDYIPGSSIWEVYVDAEKELNEIIAKAGKEVVSTLSSKSGGEKCLFNPLSVPLTIQTENGPCLIPAQTGKPKKDLVPFSFSPVKTETGSMSNGLVDVKFDSMGRIADLKIKGVRIAQSDALGKLMIYPDHPHYWDAWEIDRGTLGNGEEVLTKPKMVVEDRSRFMGEIAFSRAFGSKSKVKARYILEAGSPVLKIIYEVDLQDPKVLLKAVFPTKYSGQNARFGSPFGSTLRSQQPGESTTESKWEVPASRWAVVADDTEEEGLMLISESKYGFTCRSGSLGLSVVRSAKISGEDDQRNLKRVNPPHEVSDIGKHSIQIGVGLFQAHAPRSETPAVLADTLFASPIEYEGEVIESPLKGLSGGESIHPCWVRPMGPGKWILRLNETLGKRGRIKVNTSPGFQMSLVDLLNRPTGKTIENGVLFFSPYELISVLFSKK